MAASSAKSARKPKGGGGERREEILTAAAALFAQHGFHGVSTRDVAAAVGVSQPTLYAYFTSKAAIAGELRRRVVGALADRLSEAGGAQAVLDFAFADSDAFRLVFGQGGLGQAEPSAFEPLSEAFHAWVRGQGLTEREADIGFMGFVGGLHGLGALMACRRGFGREEADVLMEIWARGLGLSCDRAVSIIRFTDAGRMAGPDDRKARLDAIASDYAGSRPPLRAGAPPQGEGQRWSDK